MKVVVLAGGISTERDVSLISGSMIYKALKSKGHQAIIVDVYLGYENEPGAGTMSDAEAAALFEKDTDWAASIASISEINPDIEAVKALRPDGAKNFFGPNVIKLCQEADAVFMALHGVGGEDGKVQAAFELMGIPYTGTDFTSAAMAMDKAITKDLFRAWNIQTPMGFVIKKISMCVDCGNYDTCQNRNDYKVEVVNGSEEDLVYPCIVKACNGGSSVGVTIANDHDEYLKACEEAFKYDDTAVVEQYIKGREFSVGVLDGKALPIIEIAPKVGFYDYKNKYQAGSAIETCPAELDEATTLKMQGMAERAYQALRYHSYARMDFMMDKVTGEIYCLECNTLPGMTPTSLLPQEAAAIGINFEDLCELILKTAFK